MVEREQRRQQAFWDSSEEKERQRTSRRKRKRRKKKKTPRILLPRRFPRAHAVRSWKYGHIPAPCLWQSLRCRRSTGMFGYFWEMASWLRPSYLAVTCLLVFPVVCLARQWIQFYVSLQWLLGEMASGKCRCIQRLAWSVSGYTPVRQSTRHLEGFLWWYFYGPFVSGSPLFDAVRA